MISRWTAVAVATGTCRDDKLFRPCVLSFVIDLVSSCKRNLVVQLDIPRDQFLARKNGPVEFKLPTFSFLKIGQITELLQFSQPARTPGLSVQGSIMFCCCFFFLTVKIIVGGCVVYFFETSCRIHITVDADDHQPNIRFAIAEWTLLW